GDTRQIAHSQLGKVQVVALREVLPDLEDLRLHEMEVVEKPFRRGRDRLSAAHVGGQRLIGPSEDPGVLVQARLEAERALAWISRQRIAGGQHTGALLEVLHAQELAPER